MSEEKAKEGVCKWEYNMVADRGRMHRVNIEELDELGSQGWELFALQPDLLASAQMNFYFKRPKVQ